MSDLVWQALFMAAGLVVVIVVWRDQTLQAKARRAQHDKEMHRITKRQVLRLIQKHEQHKRRKEDR